MAWMALDADTALSKDTNPKHLLRLVALSMKTLALTTLPNGANIWIKSGSVTSLGKW